MQDNASASLEFANLQKSLDMLNCFACKSKSKYFDRTFTTKINFNNLQLMQLFCMQKSTS